MIPVKHGEGCWFAPPELLAELEPTARSSFATTGENPNGAVADVAGVVNERGNVMGLMPHPEHAVDPLLGSGDGALILALARRRGARARSLDARLGATPIQAEERGQLGMLGQLGAQPLEVAGAQRHRPAPRRCRPVVYEKRTSRSPPASSSWTTDANRLSPARCANADLVDDARRPPRCCARLVCHGAT